MHRSYELKEILDKIAETPALADRVEYLRQMDKLHNGRMRYMLALMFWDTKFTEVLEYIDRETFKNHEFVAGLCEDHWSYAVKDLMEKFSDSKPKNAMRVAEQICMWLEYIYDDDRVIILAAMRNEDVSYKCLTESAVRHAFPGLLPDADVGK